MAENGVFVFPDAATNGSRNGIDPTTLLALTSNGGFGGMNNPFYLMFMLPFLYPFFNMFGGWGNNGWGNGVNGGAGYLANQLNNDTGRELILQAIQGNSNAISQLSTTLNTDTASIQNGINTAVLKLQEVGSTVGLSGLQVINAIQSGNSDLAAKLAECCCENRLLTTQQGYESRIATIEQTNQLGSQADRNVNMLGNTINSNGRAITDAIAALQTNMTKEFCDIRERELQSKIDTQADTITQLRGQIDNDRQTAQLYSVISPIQAKVNEIANKQPNTVPVQWPQLTAVNTTPYVAGMYGYGWNGWGSNSFWN